MLLKISSVSLLHGIQTHAFSRQLRVKLRCLPVTESSIGMGFEIQMVLRAGGLHGITRSLRGKLFRLYTAKYIQSHTIYEVQY